MQAIGLKTLEIHVTPEFNENYLHAVEDLQPRYMVETGSGPPIVHPALLINFSNITRSPSYYVPRGMATIQTHDEVWYLNPGRVGSRFRVTWNVVATYERRGRPYQVTEAAIVDENGTLIIRRKTINTHVGGPYPGL